jgi:hypothetical protein
MMDWASDCSRKKKRGRVTEECRAWSTVGLASSSFFFFFSFYSYDFKKNIFNWNGFSIYIFLVKIIVEIEIE